MRGKWILQDLFSNILFYILIVGWGALITYLKSLSSEWVSPILYGLIASALMALLIIAIRFHHEFIREQKSKTTPENIQDKVKQWLSTFGYGFRLIRDENYNFLLDVTVSDRQHVGVGTSIQHPQYLSMKITVNIPDNSKQIFSRLPSDRQKQILHNLRIEMYRLEPEYAELFGTSLEETIQLSAISLKKRLPIITSLTDYIFIKALNDMTTAGKLLSEVLAKDIGQ